MGTMATVRVNTTQRMVIYREFIIQEAYDKKAGHVWEWAHEEYRRTTPASGLCETMFDCIDAVDRWWDEKEAA